jgi:hypothetical protein
MNHPKKVIPVKYFIYGMVITALLLVSVFYYLWQKESNEKKLLLAKGIRGEAWVLSLNETRIKKKKGSSAVDFSMDVAFFADTATPKQVTKDTAVSKAKNGTDLVDKLFNKMEAERKPMGAYTTITIPISKMSYQKYKIDDKVKIIYLREDMTIAKLTEEIE